MQILF